jgi:tetratricopeptide (TPR) repeat protein
MKLWRGSMKIWRVTVLSVLLVAACLWLVYNRETAGYFQHGNALRRQGDWQGAIDDFSNLLELKPQDAQAYYYRGCAYGYKGDWDRALADFSRTLELDPNNWRALYVQADVLDRTGKNKKEVMEAYQKFFKYAPPEAEKYLKRAQKRVLELVQ